MLSHLLNLFVVYPDSLFHQPQEASLPIFLKKDELGYSVPVTTFVILLNKFYHLDRLSKLLAKWDVPILSFQSIDNYFLGLLLKSILPALCPKHKYIPFKISMLSLETAMVLHHSSHLEFTLQLNKSDRLISSTNLF